MRSSPWLRVLLLLPALFLPAFLAGKAAAQAAAELHDLPWREVAPAADRLGPVEGTPPAATAFAGDRRVGLVFSTQAVGGSKGYSGKALDILVGLDLEGRITGARLMAQSEPIGVTGRTAADLEAFVRGYAERSIQAPLMVVRDAGAPNEIDALSGATVTSLALNDAILSAARAVARSRGLLGSSAAAVDLAGFEPVGWNQLVREGSLAVLRLTLADAQHLLAEKGGRIEPPGDPQGLFLEVTTGLASAARIGRNLVEPGKFERIAAEFAAGDYLIFIGARGRWSVKGTAWRRSGTFERLAIVQDDRTFRLTGADHRLIEEIAAEGAPELREAGLFALREASGFRPDRPWRLQVLIEGVNAAGNPVSAVAELPYTLPQRYLRPPPAPESEPPLWLGVWERRLLDIGILVTALGALTGILFFQDWLAASPVRYRRLRTAFLLFTLLWLGWYATAQLSVVNVLTFADALRTGFRWDFFLLEPLIFILWSYVAAALLFWGRGVFCGWLCPFGALQELLNLLARRFKVPQIQVPFALHERLRPIKFLIFLGLFAVALGSMAEAQRLVEAEPFKTAIVLRFLREWPFVLYALGLLVAGLFIQRFFCRYLCPLGAALAIPARIRQFEWLRRHRKCGVECHICEVHCPVQAIHPNGQIHPGECIYCLRCQVNYYDETVCPALIERRRRRERREAVARGPATPASAMPSRPAPPSVA